MMKTLCWCVANTAQVSYIRSPGVVVVVVQFRYGTVGTVIYP